jgi:protoheme ferro-lyase
VATDYDAILLVSFGGPEQPDDVVPFLENVTAGRDIPRERLEEVVSTTSRSAAAPRSTTSAGR